MNKEVSFYIAKLLKEKGFDIPCTEGWINYLASFTGETGMPDDESNLVLDRLGNPHLIERPTIAEVVMWLYEKYGIWIYIKQSTARLGFMYFIQRLNILGEVDVQNDKRYTSPIEAYEEAITYALKNLV